MEPRDEAGPDGAAECSAAPRGDRPGQSMVEFAIIVPIFILLVMFIIGFGLVFQNKIALDNAVRSGARYASSHPDTWGTTTTPSSSSPSTNSIAGRLLNSGSVYKTATGHTISITYATISTNAGSATTVPCGSYAVTITTTTGGTTIYSGSYTTSSSGSSAIAESSCLTQGSLISVSDKIKYTIPVPLVSKIVSYFFPGGVPISSNATMWEDESCASC